MKTVVIGLGNPILTDDGVGVKVAQEVRRALFSSDRHDITVLEASVGGLRLMEMTVGYDRLILIDALLSANGHCSGTVQRLTLDDLRSISPTQHSSCAHDTSLVTALEFGLRMGLHLPSQIVIYAVAVENVSEFSEQPTPAVEEAIPKVATAVLAELGSR